MKRFFIFDMDGVLVDSEPIHYEIMTLVFDELKLNLSQEYRHSLIGMAGIPMWTKIVNDYNLTETPTHYLDFHKDMFFKELPNKNIPEIEGIKDLIHLLKENNFKLAVASSSAMKLIDIFTHQLGIKSSFDVIISGADLQRSKPYPDIFLKVANQFGTNPQNCIVLEDSTNGIIAAKSAGMYCIGFQNPNSGNQDYSKADLCIKSIQELTIEVLKSI